MKQPSILIAKVVLYLMALAALSVLVILLPELAREEAITSPANARLDAPFLAVAYIVSVPFFVALYQAHRLFGYLEHNEAFSGRAVAALKTIRNCAVTFCALIALTMIAGIVLARRADPAEDMTAFAMFGFILTFASGVVATAAGAAGAASSNAPPISPTMPAILAVVTSTCTRPPHVTPARLIAAKNAIAPMPHQTGAIASCAPSTRCANSPKTMAMPAIDPGPLTQSSIQTSRNPQSGPNPSRRM